MMKKDRKMKKLHFLMHPKMYFFIMLAIFIAIGFVSIKLSIKNINQDDANKLVNALISDSSDYQVVNGEYLDKERLLKMNYNEIRQTLNLKSDVGIYFEEDNEIVPVNGVFCLGSPNIKVNGVSCKDSME